MLEKERNYSLDLLRIIALMMIVLMHSPMPDSAPGFILGGISYLTAPGIGLFFMISGALLLGNNLPTEVFLKRRFSKVVFPTFFWTLFYLVVNFLKNPVLSKEYITSVLSIPFSAQGHGVLWFMYTLSGLYLLTPILSRWLKSVSKRDVEFYLVLWGVTLIYPYLMPILKINETNTGILYYFAGYVGYYLLGYYLRYFYQFKKIHIVWAFAIVVIVPTLLYSSHLEFDFYSMLWYLSLPVALMSFIGFVLIGFINNKCLTVISNFSKLSFGVYLAHIFILRDIIWNLDVINTLPGLIQIPIIFISTLLLSFIVVWLISKLTFSKYIIGV